MYLMTCTLPDLAYPLSILARYVAPGRHRPEHMAAEVRVLRYLCSTSGMGLVLGGRSPVVLTGHADASWVDNLTTQRSSQGYTFSLGSGSVTWRSTRSSSVLSLSCEAEIYTGAMAAQELRWLTYLLTDLGEPPHSPPVLYVDNKAMLALCREHRLEHRTKHIALRYFLARELQQRGQLRLAYVASQANTADIFTKALQPCDHQRFCTMLVVLTGHADASWVDNLTTQRSSQGYTFSLGSGSVTWRSTRSSSVLSLSCEAEIYTGAMAAQELRWLTYLLTDLGEPPRSPPVLYVDNKAMLALCREHRLEHRTKHIALRYFLARELQQRGQLRLAYVASQANTADIFTKALQPCDHQRFCTMLACFALLDWRRWLWRQCKACGFGREGTGPGGGAGAQQQPQQQLQPQQQQQVQQEQHWGSGGPSSAGRSSGPITWGPRRGGRDVGPCQYQILTGLGAGTTYECLDHSAVRCFNRLDDLFRQRYGP
ncbi:unnamed protein product [Closterium sp. NIES-53]